MKTICMPCRRIYRRATLGDAILVSWLLVGLIWLLISKVA